MLENGDLQFGVVFYVKTDSKSTYPKRGYQGKFYNFCPIYMTLGQNYQHSEDLVQSKMDSFQVSVKLCKIAAMPMQNKAFIPLMRTFK